MEKEIRKIKVTWNIEEKPKTAVISNNDDESQNYECNTFTSKVSGESWVEIDLEKLKLQSIKRKKLPVEYFEEEIEVTEEQRIALYKMLSTSTRIVNKYVAMSLGISKQEAAKIINLAFGYGLILVSVNSTFRVANDILKARWKDAAIALERGERPINEDVPSTPEESARKLALQSTEEQKRIARGEGIKEEIKEKVVLPIKKKVTRLPSGKTESPIEVVDDSKIYDPAAKAKQAEREAWEKSRKSSGETSNNKVDNTIQRTLPKCATFLGVVPSTQKPVSSTPIRKK